MIYRFLRVIVFLMSRIPLPIGRFLGKILGFIASMVPLKRNKISLDNIRNSLGDHMQESQIRRLNRRVNLHFGQMLFEIPHINRLNQYNLEDYVVFKGEENLLNALKMGKGVFMFTGHFGNWELMSAAMALRFGQLAVVARPLGFAPFNLLIYQMRSRFGTEIIPKLNSMKKIFVALKKDKIVGILLDQNVDWYQGVFVNFLGRWACVNKGLALMALRTQSPVVPVFAIKHEDGRYHILIEEAVELIKTVDKTTDVEDNTALFTEIIERHVRRHPDQWFWFHRRWKTRLYCRLIGFRQDRI
jgi:KDO2-lipid IV(A) lauroyltransferase